MDLPKSTSDERSILRQKAEDLLRKKSQKSESHRYEADVLKLIHELEVNQAELEMQNKELLQTISAAADAVNLYDLVPSGYFTLSNTGEIIRLNFCGANMLGKERSSLINSNFRFFISNDTLPDFNVFLGSVFQSKVKESCEVILSVDGSEPMYIQLNGIATENGEQCLLVALDITQCKLTEKKLHENQKFLKEVQMIAIHGIFSFDLAKGKWDSSEVLDLIFGIDADFDKSAENWLSIIHPEWRQVMRDFFVQEIAARKKKFEKEYQIIRQNDQAVRWVHSIARIEFDEREQPVGMVGILSDITDRKLAEEALRESEASYRLLYENSLTGIMNANPDGAIFAANPEACRMLGRTEAEICLNGRVGIVNLADLRLPLALAERARTGHFHGELTYVRADGTVFPVDVESGIYTDSKGQNHSYNFFQDITKRKEVEEALLKNKQQYDSLVAKIPVGVYILRSKADDTFVLDYVSPRMAELLNLSIESLLSDASLVIQSIHPEDRDSFSELNINGIRLQRQFDWKGRILIDGKVSWMHFRSTPELIENGDVLWHGLIIDITDRKLAEAEIEPKNEELSRVVAEKDKFFSIIAHDLRSPFNVLLGFTQMLDDDLSTMSQEEVQRIATILKNSATNVFGLLENLLEWSRIERGITGFSPKTFLLISKITDSLQSVLELVNKKEIEICYDIPDDLEVFADDNMIGSVIRNLTSNAVKFTSRGGKIHLSAKLVHGNSVEVSVSDNGIGMSEDLLGQIFRINGRANRKGTDNESSTGLGLIICKDFIEKHGGLIWAESEEGKGSKFSFTLPGST